MTIIGMTLLGMFVAFIVVLMVDFIFGEWKW